jgi:hypothetical protein
MPSGSGGELPSPRPYRGMLPEVDELATVVVCEDDEATLELLCDHLKADRYRALAAPSASDALRLCHFKQPEVLLLVAQSDNGHGRFRAPRETKSARDGQRGDGERGTAALLTAVTLAVEDSGSGRGDLEAGRIAHAAAGQGIRGLSGSGSRG